MAADSEEIVDRVEQMREDFRALSALVSGPAAATVTALEMERRLFREVLSLGRRLLELFFLARAAQRPATPLAPDGTVLHACRLRPTTYLSVFGKVRFKRHRFFGRGQAGISPLDEALSLPARSYSGLLVDWAGHELTEVAFDQGALTLERILGLDLSKSALETLSQEDATDVDAFYEQKVPQAVASEGPILVAQADGAGVRLVNTEPSERTGHQTSKREAIVTSVYTIDRHVRSPEAMTEALLAPAGSLPACRLVRPAPVGKETRASLDGKDAALARLQTRVGQRDGPHIQDRVALTDGAEALQERLGHSLPNFTRVLDIMHVLDYLWAAAKAIHGPWLSPACHAYVRAQLICLLSGQTQAVIDDLKTRLATPKLPAHRRPPIEAAIRYFDNHAQFMHYDTYLQRGWPIASGVIEGACKHVVRGRLDRSGMQWARPGAHAMLQLRSVRINGDWDDYQRFRRQREHLRLYRSAALPDCPEALAQALAA